MGEFFSIARMPFACLCILIYSAIHLRSKKHLKSLSNIILRIILICAVFHTIFDTIYQFVIAKKDVVADWIFTAVYILFYVTLTSFLALLVYYFVLFLERQLVKLLKKTKLTLIIVYSTCVLAQIVLPIISCIVPSFDTTVFGVDNYLLYLFVAFSLGIGLVLYISYGDTTDKNESSLLFYSMGIIALIVIFQLILPSVIISGLGVSLITLGCMLSVSDTHFYMSNTVLFYNKMGCKESINEYMTLKKDFRIGVYSFLGNSLANSEAMLSIKEQLDFYNSPLLSCVYADDTLVILPPLEFPKKLVLPDVLPKPVFKDDPVPYSFKIIDGKDFKTPDEVFDKFFELHELYEESILQKDELTNALRRPAFIHQVEQLIYGNLDFTFIMLDLDNFKFINDNFGHQAGDFVLQSTSKSLREVLRSTDYICRMGGDEFGVVINGLTDTKRIQDIISSLRRRLNPIITDSGLLINVTFSIGIVINEDENKCATFHELYAKADSALYNAKYDGKDRIVFEKDKKSIRLKD